MIDLAIDFRGTQIEPGDLVCYVGRQDLKASLTEGRVESIQWGAPTGIAVTVRPSRSSSPLTQPTGKLVRLTVMRKIVVIRKRRKPCLTR